MPFEPPGSVHTMVAAMETTIAQAACAGLQLQIIGVNGGMHLALSGLRALWQRGNERWKRQVAWWWWSAETV